ncbi:DNA gyrase subunit A [Desulfitispora alkaliphila]|uniref:DNA gyrase subunit A n=1 Tax=Desulfitispora alkaliphila TaxID=622674 RepID=UPI003D19EE98
MSIFEEGKVVPIKIEDEMKKSYIDYAMSVIVGRALPDVRDGLKPVHRRILYAMYELGLNPEKSFKKSARIVGEVLGKYHPHGDTAVYDAMVRLAQNFSSRYPLVNGHGNFGSVDGDSAAAMRYTEAKMAKISSELLADIQKETVDFTPNFDDSLKEPTVLPAKVPNLLINGSSGIAVGMATNIPPHNLTEVVDGLIKVIDNPEIEIDELIKVITGPDFPTGGMIMGRDGIRSAYTTGRGSVKVRSVSHTEQLKNGKVQIVVTEIPFMVNKARMIEKIADLVRDKKVEGITDLRDESDRKGMRIVIELRRDVNPHVILNQLYKMTQLQDSFGVIMLALVDGQPKVLTLKDTLQHYIEHQKDVIVRRTKFELNKAEARAHIVEGLRIALDNLDAVIKTIRQSRTTEIAKEALMDGFDLSEKQAQAILDMRLQRLTGLEREKLEAEYKELLDKISYFKSVLADENLVLKIIKEELEEVKQKYGDKRRTQINEEDTKIEIEDLIEEEEVVITMTHNGYIKRMPTNVYKSQKRGGRGVAGQATRESDMVEHLFVTTTHHHLMVFTNKGKVYRLKVYEIPESSRQSKGTAIINLLGLTPAEVVTALIPVKTFDSDTYLFMATKNGIVKKTALSAYDTSRKDGIIAIHIDDNDELIGVKMTKGQADVILATRNGLTIRFPEENVRSMGRISRGVKGITLSKGDYVESMVRCRDNSDVLVVTDKGFGKRTDLDEFRVQSRGGKGIIGIRLTEKTGKLVAIRAVDEGDELLVVSAEGIIIRFEITDISRVGRTTQGVRLMKLSDNDKVVAVARIKAREREDN